MKRRESLDDAIMRAATAARDVLHEDKLTTVEKKAAYEVLRVAAKYAREVGYTHSDLISNMLRKYDRDDEWRSTVKGIVGSLRDD